MIRFEHLYKNGGIYIANHKNSTFDISSNEKFKDSILLVEKKLTEEEFVDLNAAIGYLSYKYAFTNFDHDYFNLNLNKQELNRLLKIFGNKNELEIIKEAKKLAKEEDIKVYNTTDINAFIKSYYAMILNLEKKDKTELSKMNEVLQMIEVKYLEDTKLKETLSKTEYKKITENIINRNLISFTGKKLNDTELSNIINHKVSIDKQENEIKEIIKNNFDQPENKVDKLERIKNTLLYLKQIKNETGYRYTQSFDCNLKNLEIKEYKITNQTINGKEFKTVDFILTNKNSDYDSINLYTIFKDKYENFFIQNSEVSFNNLIGKTVPIRIKTQVKEDNLKLVNIKDNEIKVYKVIPRSCNNSIMPNYNNKKELIENIEHFENEIKKY